MCRIVVGSRDSCIHRHHTTFRHGGGTPCPCSVELFLARDTTRISYNRMRFKSWSRYIEWKANDIFIPHVQLPHCPTVCRNTMKRKCSTSFLMRETKRRTGTGSATRHCQFLRWLWRAHNCFGRREPQIQFKIGNVSLSFSLLPNPIACNRCRSRVAIQFPRDI